MDEAEQLQVTAAIVDSAIKVHKALGPGLLESAYEACLSYELSQRGLIVQRQVVLPVVYNGVAVEAGYRIDMLIAGSVVVELKTCAAILPIHKAQLLSYLKLSGLKVGLLLNFHVERLKDGIVRMVF